MPKIPEIVSTIPATLSQNRLYFNEILPYPAQWLRNLWPGNVVDEQSIVDVRGADLFEYDRVHFFAGLGGWQHALELAEWPKDEVVWTGSCPCQPFSTAGKQQGEKDARHLWPEMCRLIGECLPPTIFGEQVAGKLGLQWLDGVCSDLESLGYAVAAAVLPAASVGAPHRRNRIYWVAYSDSYRRTRLKGGESSRQQNTDTGDTGKNRCMDDFAKQSSGNIGRNSTNDEEQRSSNDIGSPNDDSTAENGLADPESNRQMQESNRSRKNNKRRDRTRNGGDIFNRIVRHGAIDKPWNQYIWVECSDGKRRRIPSPEQGILPLAPRLPRDVEQISAYGNAIVPQLAATFIKSFLEARAETRANSQTK